MYYELENGEKVLLTITNAALYKLRAENRPEYDRYLKTISTPRKDFDLIFDVLTVIYTGYLCGLQGTDAQPVSYEEFLDLAKQDADENAQVYLQLTSKKKAASVNRS